MTDLDYLFKNLEEFKSEYSEFSVRIPSLVDAFKHALDFPTVNTEHDYLVLALCKMCVDRFEDILILSTQRRGEGAMALVRVMFESLVNASYIQAHPEKAGDFIRYLFVFIRKVQNQIENLNKQELDASYKRTIEKALEKYAADDGGIPRRSNDWTELNLVDRAKDVGLGERVVAAYYLPMETIHPSMIHVYGLSKKKDGQMLVFGNSQEFSQEKVKSALSISHGLAIEALSLLHETFGDASLEPKIMQVRADSGEVWAS